MFHFIVFASPLNPFIRTKEQMNKYIKFQLKCMWQDLKHTCHSECKYVLPCYLHVTKEKSHFTLNCLVHELCPKDLSFVSILT